MADSVFAVPLIAGGDGMDWGPAITTAIASLSGLIGLSAGELRARRQLRSDLEAKRWTEIMACVRIVEGEEPQLLKMAARQRLRELAFDLIEPSGPDQSRRPASRVSGINPRAPAQSTPGFEYTNRPSWERLSRKDRQEAQLKWLQRAVLLAAASGVVTAAVQTTFELYQKLF